MSSTIPLTDVLGYLKISKTNYLVRNDVMNCRFKNLLNIYKINEHYDAARVTCPRLFAKWYEKC